MSHCLSSQFPLRPGKDVHILADFVRPEIEAPRTLWSTKVCPSLNKSWFPANPLFKLSNTHLQDRAAAFATGLLRLARLQPQKSNVLLLLNDCLGKPGPVCPSLYLIISQSSLSPTLPWHLIQSLH
jgi:long-chain acyl-CoA synthetase